jgi:hypothetical protein
LRYGRDVASVSEEATTEATPIALSKPEM